MSNFFNRVKMTVSGTPGAGPITLGAAVTGFRSFSAAGVLDQMPVSYVIEDGSSWEVGHGIYTAAGATLARTPLETSAGNTSPISASSAATVYIAALAQDLAAPSLEASGAYIVPPAAASWTLNNPTIDGSGNQQSHLIDINIPRVGLRLWDPFPAYRQGNFPVSALLPTPGTHFVFQTRLRRHTPLFTGTSWGLVLRDGSSGGGRSCIIGPNLNAAAIGIDSFTNDATFLRRGNFTDTRNGNNMVDVLDLWLRLGWDGTHYNFEHSRDGSYWATLVLADPTFNGAFDSAFQPTQIGFGYNAANGLNTQQEVDCFSWAAMAQT